MMIMLKQETMQINTTTFAALALIKTNFLHLSTEEIYFLLHTAKMNEKRWKTDANFTWIISRFQPLFNISLSLILT